MVNHQSGNFVRCARHPSQSFTGFCPSCLVERLSNVNTTKKSLEAHCSSHSEHSEIVEVPDVMPDVQKKHREIKVRRTLQYLFELDSDLAGDRDKFSEENQTIQSTSITDHEISYYGDNYSKDSNINHDSCTGTATRDSNTIVSEKITIDARIANGIHETEGEKLKVQGISFWMSSMLARRGLIWHKRKIVKKNQAKDTKSCDGCDVRQLENTPKLRNSCDWRVCLDANRSSSDPPRHSWDGSTVSKALTCSFACLEERERDLKSIKRNFPADSMCAKPNQTSDVIEEGKVNSVPMSGDKPFSSNDNIETLFGERLHEESQRVNNVPSIRRKNSRGWIKVWDWTITSSFRDLVKKHEHILQRSVSENWQRRKNKNVEGVNSDLVLQSNGNCHVPVGVDHSIHQTTNVAHGDVKNLSSDWQTKNKCKIGRSRSVHYLTPRNSDTGLLRFYLTPLRSSRRCTSKGRTKTSNHVGRGIFGLY